ncbi:FKBP-type peptidyl-prolyl cis-trans isomerase [Aliamphritea spongicola]|nr:FKBP-type peptidyl-prolyl cis-trans isomerase [Aliamphritea spongicola]
MKITKDKVVQFHYNLSAADDSVQETSRKGNPMLYLHGHDNMIKGLEAAMNDRETGDVFSVTLAPEDAYGAFLPNCEQVIQKKHLQGKRTGSRVWLLPFRQIKACVRSPLLRWGCLR